jgi:hypothetical protein
MIRISKFVSWNVVYIFRNLITLQPVQAIK